MSDNSSKMVDEYLMELYMLNRSLGQPWFSICVALYSILVSIAFTGNVLVLVAMVRSRDLRKSARNVLIGLLAISDLFLSCTMPLTAIDALSKYWPFGKTTLTFCRTVKTSSAMAVYLSSMTLIAIALDRHRCIVHPTRSQLSVFAASLVASTFLLVALLMATPIFFHTRLHVPISETTANTAENQTEDDWSHLVFCVEDWRFGSDQDADPRRRIYYSIFSMAMQYIIPFISMTAIYTKLFFYLKTNRMVRSERPQDKQKARRTNTMLATISMVFCISWLPLNLIGICLDAQIDMFGDNIEMMTLTFVACHLIGMSSACINPIMYGYLNETFRTEFLNIAQDLKNLVVKSRICTLALAISSCKQCRNKKSESKSKASYAQCLDPNRQTIELNQIDNCKAKKGGNAEKKISSGCVAAKNQMTNLTEMKRISQNPAAQIGSDQPLIGDKHDATSTVSPPIMIKESGKSHINLIIIERPPSKKTDDHRSAFDL